jgi:hypothetical protein
MKRIKPFQAWMIFYGHMAATWRVFPTAKEARRKRVGPERIVRVEIREAKKEARHV